MELHHYEMHQLADMLARKEISSADLTLHYLNRIEKYNSEVNAFIHHNPEYSLEAAKQADKQRAQGDKRAMLGVPIAQKDIFCTRDMPTTAASHMLKGFMSPFDATLIEKCHQEGLIMLGKTNMDEFAMGSSNENSAFGPCKNPWNHSKVPGGSSGGSAAAVAARLAPISTGTDTGGSIRQPAAFCNLTGLKPSYGCVSRFGMIAFASSLDQAGPMALSAKDAALLMNVIAGPDKRDSTSLPHAPKEYTHQLDQPLKGLRVGLPDEYLGEGLHPDIHQAVLTMKDWLEQEGATIHAVSLARTKLATPTYYIIAPSEASSNLARFDGVRYGYRCDNPASLEDLYKRSRHDGFGPEVKRRIMIGTYTLSSGFYDAYYRKAQKIRQLISDDFKQAFEKVDVILGPTTPSPAFGLAEKTNDPLAMYLNDIYTIAVNMAGLPAIAFPAGRTADLPIGLQLIGPSLSEAKLLQVVHQYQQQSDWHRMIPSQYI